MARLEFQSVAFFRRFARNWPSLPFHGTPARRTTNLRRPHRPRRRSAPPRSPAALLRPLDRAPTPLRAAAASLALPHPAARLRVVLPAAPFVADVLLSSAAQRVTLSSAANGLSLSSTVAACPAARKSSVGIACAAAIGSVAVGVKSALHYNACLAGALRAPRSAQHRLSVVASYRHEPTHSTTAVFASARRV